MNSSFSRIEIRDEPGVIEARQQARTIAERLGFPARDRLGIASSVTHAACEAVRHAGGGRVEFGLDDDTQRSLVIRVIDRPSNPSDHLPGSARDFEPVRHWMDRFEVEDRDGQGVTVSMARRIPERNLPLDPSTIDQIREDLLGFRVVSPIAEILDQDLALFRSFDEIGGQARELAEFQAELEESRAGIVALHTELSERAERLRSLNDLKARFLSRVSHELRTPLASILGLARLLLDRADGELAVEQERQVSFISRSAHDLLGLINDLLDLARMEAGRETLRLSRVHVPAVFAVLRGMFRPLVPPNSAVVLTFDEPRDLPPLWSDEAKLTQVLRNFLSNALKFTESGEIRVQAEPGPDQSIVFSVTDTGMGIAPEHLERVFEEFTQAGDNAPSPGPGMGLGLPLARKLARKLGGRVDVRSEPGVGSTFSATIPIHYAGQADAVEDDLNLP